MQFIGKPKPLLPFMNRKECSLRLCSTFCPEWCDGIFPPPGPPPPPPPPFSFPDDKSETSPTFSPLVIATIGILASAFLLVSYYAVITKYCGNSNSSQRNREVRSSHNEEFFEEDYDDGRNTNTNTNTNTEHHHHEAWLINTPGLDEALIKKITLVKFRKGDGLITTTDCSVCLGEFLEDDTLRLLPKCCHAFHVACIDTWLRSHLNCPLCRANVISTYSQPPPNHNNNHHHPHLVVIQDQPPPNNNNNSNSNNNNNNNSNSNNSNNVIQDHSSGLQNQVANEEVSSSGERRQMDVSEEQANENLPKTPFRALSDLGDRSHGERDTVRRSMSMDQRYETRVSIPDGFRCSHGEDCIVKSCQLHEQSFKRAAGESSKFSSNGNGVLHSVKSGVAMKRSFSSGRFLFSKHVKGKNAVIPL